MQNNSTPPPLKLEPLTVPESSGKRIEFLHERGGWIPCDMIAETDAGFTVNLGRMRPPWAGVRYDVPASQIRDVH